MKFRTIKLEQDQYLISPGGDGREVWILKGSFSREVEGQTVVTPLTLQLTDGQKMAFEQKPEIVFKLQPSSAGVDRYIPIRVGGKHYKSLNNRLSERFKHVITTIYYRVSTI